MVVIFMDVISVVCVNGVDVIVIFEVVLMLVVESLVSKHSDKANKLNSYHIRYYLLKFSNLERFLMPPWCGDLMLLRKFFGLKENDASYRNLSAASQPTGDKWM